MAGRPRLVLVVGEPAGIGPELCVKIAQRALPCELTVLADAQTLMDAAARMGLPLQCKQAGAVCGISELAVEPFALPQPSRPGQLLPENSAQVIAALFAAGTACLKGEYQGLITGPVHKAAVNAAGIAYTGTTELLAEQAGVPVVMMLANPHLRVALATTHLPLRQVADAITQDSLESTLRILHSDLKHRFKLSSPRIRVLGLNPHAGEQGILGHEETDILIPVMERLRREGFQLEGPTPADTAFLPESMANTDAILAMYHDQGLPVLKHSGFEQAVNITLGLPYPRVAVDHGTALDLAGTGLASDESLWQAIQLCCRLAEQEMHA